MRKFGPDSCLLFLALAACGPGPTVVSDPAQALEPRSGAPVSASASASASAKPRLEVAGGTGLPRVLPPFSCGAGKEIVTAMGTYCVFTDLRTWSEAEQHCEEHGGHLASMTSEAEVRAIRAAIVSTVSREPTLWIGLVEPSEGRWLWSDAKPARFFAWHAGEPNNGKGAENCGEWLIGSGRWNDVDCFLSRPSLCESRVPASSKTSRLPCVNGTQLVVGKREYCLQGSATWQNAQTTCAAAGGDLAIVDSAEENDALFAAIGAKIDVGNMWIGLSDADVEGRFRWVSGEPIGELPWRDGEPNNVGDEDCAEWLPSDGQANDLSCNEKRASLCKKPVPGVSR